MYLVVLLAGVSALVQIVSDPRITPAFMGRSLGALALYAAHVAVGLAALFHLMPLGPEHPLALTTAAVAWMCLGGLVLVRTAPRLTQPPAMLMKFGVPDVVCLIVLSTGLLSMFPHALPGF